MSICDFWNKPASFSFGLLLLRHVDMFLKFMCCWSFLRNVYTKRDISTLGPLLVSGKKWWCIVSYQSSLGCKGFCHLCCSFYSCILWRYVSPWGALLGNICGCHHQLAWIPRKWTWSDAPAYTIRPPRTHPQMPHKWREHSCSQRPFTRARV